MNRNLTAFRAGLKFRLESVTGNLGRSEPEFVPTKTSAAARKKALQASGDKVAIFEITEASGLIT